MFISFSWKKDFSDPNHIYQNSVELFLEIQKDFFIAFPQGANKKLHFIIIIVNYFVYLQGRLYILLKTWDIEQNLGIDSSLSYWLLSNTFRIELIYYLNVSIMEEQKLLL